MPLTISSTEHFQAQAEEAEEAEEHTEMQAIEGYDTTYRTTQAGSGRAMMGKGSTVTVHAMGVVKQTGAKFWSTKDAPAVLLPGGSRGVSSRAGTRDVWGCRSALRSLQLLQLCIP